MRPARTPGALGSGEHDVVRPFPDEESDRPTLRSPTREFVERGERLERKLRFARVLLQLLPTGDSRARALRAAVIRRDETLLDGMLRVLDPANDLAEPEEPSAGMLPGRADEQPQKRPRTLLPPAPDPDAEPEPEEID